MNEFFLIKGIGPRVREYLEKLEIFDLNDLISHYPFRYEILKRSNLKELNQDDKIIIDGVIEQKPSIFRFKKNMNKMNFLLNVKTNVLKVEIYNRGFLINNLGIGKKITVIGKFDKKKNLIIASDILFLELDENPIILPIYKTTTGLNKKAINNFIKEALKVLKYDVVDNIPKYISDSYNFSDKYNALLNIHNPNDINSLKKSMIRLKYEELFMFMLKINYLKLRQKENVGVSKLIDKKLLEKILNNLEFELTKDQKNSLNEILSDLESDIKMNRLLQGDVGSGKTIVALIASYLTIKSGFQVAFMAPTEILAKQHFLNALKLYKDVKIELLTGSLNKSEKLKIYKKIENNEIDFVIGTHALIQEDVVFNNLGLIITDEQHRFGVNQRGNLKNKGKSPDILYMSATPIPRTYALTIYGDMEISTIKTLPKGKKEIKTILKEKEEIKDILFMIKKQLDLNHQVYVVAPVIEDESEKDNVILLQKRYEKAFLNKKIKILHGKMKQKEKDKVMEEFKNNEIDILISTTVIEVGVDVKNATMIVIHDADYFGLFTLHQLRGRVGRSDLDSYCILIGNKNNKRLQILEQVSDGFYISEEDFKLRGSGDLFGIRQSGYMSFKIADIKADYKILIKAKEDSMEFLKTKNLNDYLTIKKELKKSVNLD